MRYIFLLYFLVLGLVARENPFQELLGEKDIDMSEAPNLPKPKYFTTEKINLPTSARVVENIIVKYKNIDGSIAQKSIRVNKDIDWHYPLIVTHTKKDTPLKLGHKVLANIPPPISDNIALASKKILTLKPFDFLSIDIYKNRIFLQTKDLKIRSFITANPSKIIVDLDRDIPHTKKLKINEDSFFKEIEIGRHNKYYRVALRLDGKYNHTLKKVDGGYLVEVK